jgi:hypothetical protein
MGNKEMEGGVEGGPGSLFYHYTVTIALVSDPPINPGNVRGLYN